MTRGAFGPVIAAGLIGMGCGAGFSGPFGDRFGRRTALIGTVLLFSLVTAATAFAGSLPVLGLLRFLAGLGIGGAMPNATALAAEFVPVGRRAIAVSVTMICVPLGGMIAGLAAAQILPGYGWRMLFAAGGVAPLLLCVLLWFVLPESPGFRAGAPKGERASLAAVFAPELLRDTLILWLLFFCNLLAVYMAFSWLPTLLTAEGLGLAAASSGLAFYNLGGVAGVLICGAFITRFGSRVPLLVAALGAVASALFMKGWPGYLLAGFAANGFFVNAVQVASFALAAHVYPAKIRSTGIAFALAFGRLGPVLSAFLGAGLIQAGRGAFLSFLALVMGCTFVALALLRNHIPRTQRGQGSFPARAG